MVKIKREECVVEEVMVIRVENIGRENGAS